MKLAGARIALDGSTTVHADLEIRDHRIAFTGRGFGAVDLSGYLLLPGLINAHDHLELNLFPRLGKRIYNNAAEWARDIYHPDETPVREHLKIPKCTRLIWGGLKNLLSGVTTVAHHNPYDQDVFDHLFPVRVLKNFGWAHSLDFSPDLAERFRSCDAQTVFILHGAEGTDQTAGSEIARLNKSGVLSDRTVLVHAIAAGKDDVSLLRRKGVSIIWCPTSNLATYGTTLNPDVLRSGIPIALGSDSAISADGDLLDEIRAAHCVCGLAPIELYPMVTTQAARILKLRNGEGTIRDGGAADLVAVQDHGQSPARALLDLRPEFVMVGGEIRLLSEDAARRFGRPAGFSGVGLEGRGAWLIDADIQGLVNESASLLGAAPHLAGKRVSAA